MVSNSISRKLGLALLAASLPLLAACVSDEAQLSYDQPMNYSGTQNHPIKVHHGRAHVAKCGRWEQDLTDTDENTMSPNHGCATQHNVAAMLARPSDINAKPKMSPRNSALDAEAVTSTQSSKRSGGLFELFFGG